MEQQSTPLAAHESRLRVRDAETHQMGVVYYANYLIWMEVGRVELVRALGVWTTKELEHTEGLYLSVVEANCRYIRPARFDQEIAVETRITEANSRMVALGYRVLSLNPDRVLAKGTTRHMWLNREFRPTRLPVQYQAKLRIG